MTIGKTLVKIEDTSITNQVKPDGTVSVSFKIANNGHFVNPTDVDYCIAPNLHGGYRLHVTAHTESGSKVFDQTICVAEHSTSKTKSFQFSAPHQTGRHTVSITVAGSGSGVESSDSPMKLSYQVKQTAPSGSAQTCPKGYVLQNGKCVPKSTNRRPGINLGRRITTQNGTGINLGAYVLQHPVESAAIGIGGAIVLSSVSKSIGNNLP